jgi:tetratricopeptide (TPR) repeat protein
MVATSNERPAPETETTKVPDLPARASSSPARIVTRRQLARTRLSAGHGVLKVDAETNAERMRPSIVTRRQAWLRRRRRKRILITFAIVLGLFPPMWAVYLLAWMIWRSRPPQKSMRRVHHAVRALEKNRTGIALQQLQEAHLLDPTNNDALYWLGLLLSKQDRQAEAAEALSLVADRVPGLPEVESALVDAYVATDEPESAVYHAQRLLEAAPYAPDTPLKLSIAHEAAGRPDLAIEALHQAPLHKYVLTDTLVQIHYRLGTLYECQGDPAQALHHFNRVYARNPAYRDVRARVETLEAGQDH